ncbi:MAG: methyltransferase domain-containing protein [Opitutae bacterium]|nr:methyltransferase domain-containing protein [Opitutae bacterium]
MSDLPPSSARHYPLAMEDWWKEQVELSDVHTLENLHRNTSVLSDHFTIKRDKGFPDYFKKPGHLLAYGIYFHPKSWARIRYPILEAIKYHHWKIPENKPLSILDVGSGPGSASLSALQLLSTLNPELKLEATAVDQSPHALDALRRSHADLRSLWPGSSINTHAKNLRHRDTFFYSGKQRFDLVFLSFSLNEFFAGRPIEDVVVQLKAACRKLLKKKGLLIIMEPALRETSRNLRNIADRLLDEEDLYGWGPYLHQGPCPFQETGKFWCHEVRAWRPPNSMEYVNRRMQRKIHELKYSFISLSPSPPPASPSTAEHFRMVSPMSRMKGHFLMTGVASDGQEHVYELLFRNLNTTQKRTLRKMERGDFLKVQNLENVGKRLRIPKFEDIIQHFHVG